MTPAESYLKRGAENIYVRHGAIERDRPTLLFVHGLGDSGLNFEDVFRYSGFERFNVVIPDLVGYGRSSAAEGDRYGFEAHLDRLWWLIDQLGLDNIILIGHSMGADITIYLCRSDRKGVIRKYVCVEGDVAPEETFISAKAAEAEARGEFATWFEKFRDRLMYEALGSMRSGRLYYTSLRMARAEVFRQDALDLYRRANMHTEHNRSDMGRIYIELPQARIFCYGTASLKATTLDYLESHGMKVRPFQDAGHFPCSDMPDEFYPFLYEYITETM